MTTKEFETLRLDRNGPLLTITLDRPAQLNAFSQTLHLELGRCLFELRHDRETRVVILTGAGAAFSAGGDMTEAPPDPAGFARGAAEGREIVYGLLDCPQLIICKMNGDAVGLGATVALLCDFVFASDTARIGDPHVRMGLVAGDGGALIWPLLVGPMLARYYLLTGELVPAAEAAKLGLITRCVEASALDGEVDNLARKLLAGAPLAQQFTKRSINAALRSMASLQFDLSLGYEGVTVLSSDHAEARAAFVARRKPSFEGR